MGNRIRFFLIAIVALLTTNTLPASELTEVRMWLRYDVKPIWSQTPEAQKLFQQLGTNRSRALEIKAAADACLQDVDRRIGAEKAAGQPSAYKMSYGNAQKYYGEITECLNRTYTVENIPLIRGVAVATEQCESAEKECTEWRTPYLEWARIRDYVLDVRRSYESSAGSAIQAYKAIGAVFGGLGGFIVGNHVATDLNSASVSLLGKSIPFAQVDMGSLATMMTPTFGVAAGVIGALVSEWVASEVAFILNRDTMEAFQRTEAMIFREEAKILTRLGTEKVIDLSPTFLKSMREILPYSMLLKLPKQPIKPDYFWPLFRQSCRSSQTVSVAQQSVVDTSDANGPDRITFLLTDSAASLCDLAYQPLKGYVYVLDMSGRKHTAGQTLLPGATERLLAAGNLIGAMINVANLGMLPQWDNTFTPISDRFEFDTANWSVPPEEAAFRVGHNPNIRYGMIDITLKGDPTSLRLRQLAAMERTLATQFHLYRPQKFSSTSSTGRDQFARSVLKSYGRWFARRLIDNHSAASEKPASERAERFITTFERLVDSIDGRIVDSLGSKKLQTAYTDTKRASTEFTQLEKTYVELRQKDGSRNLAEDQLFRDMQNVLRPLKFDFNRNPLASGNTLMGAKRPSDAYFAASAFRKAIFVLDIGAAQDLISADGF